MLDLQICPAPAYDRYQSATIGTFTSDADLDIADVDFGLDEHLYQHAIRSMFSAQTWAPTTSALPTPSATEAPEMALPRSTYQPPLCAACSDCSYTDI
jgi:hypothetical protein